MSRVLSFAPLDEVWAYASENDFGSLKDLSRVPKQDPKETKDAKDAREHVERPPKPVRASEARKQRILANLLEGRDTVDERSVSSQSGEAPRHISETEPYRHMHNHTLSSNVFDLVLYGASGLLLIMILDQFIQLGMRAKS